MKNPYQRLREACGISQRAFATKYELSKTSVVYVEAGCWTDVPDRMNAAIASECSFREVDGKQILSEEYQATKLSVAYKVWQIQERAKVADRFRAVGPEFYFDKNSSPFQYYVTQTAGTDESFAKLAKVQPILVRRYARGESKSMPGQIHEALVDMEYPYTRELLERQAAWWQEHVG